MNTSDIEDLFRESLERGEARTIFRGLDLSRKTFVDQTLSCVDFRDCNLTGTTFIRCDVRGSDFSASRMRRVTFRGCMVFGCLFPAERVIFEDCIRSQTKMCPQKEPSRHETLLKVVSGLLNVSTERILALTMMLALATILVAISKI